MVFLAMGRDSADGRIELLPLTRELCVRWNLRDNLGLYETEQRLCTDIARQLGGEVALNPFWQALRLPVSVHNLGGCLLADDPRHGVVDGTGEVFGYPNLYVLDGACLPSATVGHRAGGQCRGGRLARRRRRDLQPLRRRRRRRFRRRHPQPARRARAAPAYVAWWSPARSAAGCRCSLSSPRRRSPPVVRDLRARNALAQHGQVERAAAGAVDMVEPESGLVQPHLEHTGLEGDLKAASGGRARWSEQAACALGGPRRTASTTCAAARPCPRWRNPRHSKTGLSTRAVLPTSGEIEGPSSSTDGDELLGPLRGLVPKNPRPQPLAWSLPFQCRTGRNRSGDRGGRAGGRDCRDQLQYFDSENQHGLTEQGPRLGSV
jgi:hypothetical protein